MTRRGSPARSSVEQVAVVTERLAVLLAAGVPPGAAWRYIGEPPATRPKDRRRRGSTTAIVRAASEAADRGDDVADAIADAARELPVARRDAWRGLGGALAVATKSGAPLAPCLRNLASVLRSLEQTERDISVALAGPRSTARLVMALPFVGLLFGLALGFDTTRVLTTVPGMVCVGTGALLMVLGWWWNTRMVRRATPKDTTPGLSIDLVAIAMSGGAAVDRARATAESVVEEYGVSNTGTATIDDVLALARRAGVPASELLRSEAEQARRAARSDGQRAAATLATKLMLPLGACVLPAFMLLGVAPLMLSILSSTSLSI